MGKQRDHIWPQAEDGPDDEWNIRDIDASENQSKGARMPNLDEVFDSSDPIRLAAEIDKHTLEEGLRHPRNRDRGFGGLPRR